MFSLSWEDHLSPKSRDLGPPLLRFFHQRTAGSAEKAGQSYGWEQRAEGGRRQHHGIRVGERGGLGATGPSHPIPGPIRHQEMHLHAPYMRSQPTGPWLRAAPLTVFTLGETPAEFTCYITGPPPGKHRSKTWKTTARGIPYFILSKKIPGSLQSCTTHASIRATYQPSSPLQCSVSHTNTALPCITCINTKEETSRSSTAAGEHHCDSALPRALPCTGSYRRRRSSKTSRIVSPDKK